MGYGRTAGSSASRRRRDVKKRKRGVFEDETIDRVLLPGGLAVLRADSHKDAANSLGINGDRIQILTIIFSGALSGLGGVLLTMGGVTLFAQNITAGRGYIAMASASLGAAHPIGTIVSSAFFGLAQSLANFLQNSSISSELTMAIPYAATIFALMAYNSFRLRSPRRQSEPK